MEGFGACSDSNPLLATLTEYSQLSIFLFTLEDKLDKSSIVMKSLTVRKQNNAILICVSFHHYKRFFYTYFHIEITCVYRYT